MIRNGSSWTNRSWCWMWLEQRSVEEHGQLRLDFTNFHELKPFLKYIKGHKLKINFTLVEKWKMSPRIYTVRSQIDGLEFLRKEKGWSKKTSRVWIKSEIVYGKKWIKIGPVVLKIWDIQNLITEKDHCSTEKHNKFKWFLTRAFIFCHFNNSAWHCLGLELEFRPTS